MKHCKGSCAGDRCAACYWHRNSQALLDQHPWLEAFDEPGFRVGCSLRRKKYGDQNKALCKGGGWRSGLVTGYGSLQPRALEKHAGSREHQNALGEDPDLDSAGTPDEDGFQELLKHCQRSVIGKSGLANVGGQKKCRKMIWCLAEAFREWRQGVGVDQQKLIFSTTLFQDARKGRLCVRFASASSAAERLSGHIWTVDAAKDFSLDAIGAAKATKAAVRLFCTPCASPPHHERPHTAAMDTDLYSLVSSSIESFVSDSASDEVRAGHLLAGQRASGDYIEAFPNLRVVSRDKPHTTRRNLSRGWNADAYLEDVAQRFWFGENSPAKMIQFSEVFRGWFASAIKQLEPGLSAVKAQAHIQHLGFAAHRYDSAATPLSRIVLFFFAFLQTTQRVAMERTDEKGKAAASFLEWLNAERSLQLAMLADCAVENLELTRLVDYEGFPTKDLPMNLCAFRDRIRALFTDNDPGCLRMGLTGHMLRLLDRGFLINFPGRQMHVKELWRPSAILTTACVCRMANWVRLTEATLTAEFPSFEVVQAFAAFSLKQGAGSQHGGHLLRTSQIARLQNAFKIGHDEAAEVQLQRLWHVARRIADEQGSATQDAWLQAVQHVTRSWSKQSVSAALPLLVRFWCSGASSSGVEQAFSRAKGLSDHLQLMPHVNDITEAQALIMIFSSASLLLCWLLVADCFGPISKVVLEVEPHAEVLEIRDKWYGQVAKNAQKLWARFYGVVRASGTSHRHARRDLGCPRPRDDKDSDSKPSLAGWMRARHAAVGVEAQLVQGDAANPAGNLQDYFWQRSHEKEMNFIEDKRAMRVAEEVVAGRREMLQTLSTEELQRVLRAVERKRKCDQDYLRDHRAKLRKQQAPQAPDIDGWPVFFQDSSEAQKREVADVIRQKQLRVTTIQVACTATRHPMFHGTHLFSSN